MRVALSFSYCLAIGKYTLKMSTDSEEQIRALTELVKQLQAETVNVAGSSAMGNPTFEWVYVCAPGERKCPRFSGIMAQDSMIVEDWVEEAWKSLAVLQTSRGEQETFLCDLLDGEAKREVKFSTPEDRANPESIFTMLLDNFGCDQTYMALQKQFFQRRQHENESIICEFSHALLELMLECKDPRGVLNLDLVTSGTFIENVCDDKLQHEIAHLVRQHPTHSFKDVRNAAIKWAKRGLPTSIQRARAYSCDSHASAVSQGNVDTNAITVRPSDDLGELKECFRQQQAQLDAILKHLGISSTASNNVVHQDLPCGNRPRP